MFERWVAYKVKIKDLLGGEWVEDKEKEIKFLKTKDGKKLVRVRILGIIVAKFISEDENYASLTIDDGSGVIRVKIFKEEVKKFANFEKGDCVDIIGRVREYEGENYIIPEIIVKIEDPNYEFLRRIELEILRKG